MLEVRGQRVERGLSDMAHSSLETPSSRGDRTNSKAGTNFVEYGQFIDQQIRKTRSNLKAVDFASAVMTMMAAALAYFLVVALLEHWMVPGGLGVGSRLLLLLLLIGGSLYFLYRQILPLVVRSINPIYAAHTIERSTPSLKNSLLSFLMFRRDRTGVPGVVYEAIEEQAATRLSQVSVETAVDRSQIIRIGYWLLAIVTACCLYKLVSPKDPIVTARRVLLPWANIRPPTRVLIVAVDPGNTTAARGDQLTVSAEIQHVAEGDPVRLYFTTEDGQTVDRPIAMHVPSGDDRYACLLPESSSGIGQDVRYRIEAGDAISPTYRIRVTAAPTIVVEGLEYVYPKYTGWTSRRAEREGDVKAIEGTRVTVHARANHEIKSATIDFDSDGRSDLRMKHRGMEADISFTLALKDDRRTPQHDSYRLGFTNRDGQDSRQPIQYRIEVTPDLSPEIEILAPKEDDVEVPLNGMLEIETHASDPDFALEQVLLRGVVGDRQVFEFKLLDHQQSGQFVGKTKLVPIKNGLKVGDVVEFWGVAQDIKSPQPNERQTARKRLRIMAPHREESSEDGRAGDGSDEKSSGNPPPDEGAGRGDDSHEPKDKGQDEGQDGEADPSEGQQRGGSPDQGQQGKGDSPDQGQQGKGDSRDRGQQGKSDRNSDSSAGENRPEDVANDGTDDGGVFEQVLRRLRSEEKEGSDGDQSSDGTSQEPSQADRQERSADGARSEETSNDGARPDESPRDAGGRQKGAERKRQQDEQDSHPDGAANRNQRPAEGETARPDRHEAVGGEKNSANDPTGEQDETQPNGQRRGDGGRQDDLSVPEPAATDPAGRRASGDQPGKPDAGGGDSRQPKEGSGSGGDEQDGHSPPKPQEVLRQREKGPGKPQGLAKPDAERAESPAHGKHESDSSGADGGDKSGDGDSGGGQQSDREGKGSSGESTPAEEGAGRGDSAGGRDPGDRPGQDVPSDRPTGQPSDDSAGPGSGRRPDSSGNPPAKSDDPGTPESSDSPSASPGEGGGHPTGGGGQPARSIPPARPETIEPVGDDANLKYARKATDLVLEHLEDQLKTDQVEDKLLDRLGWSREDIERFVRRWKKMKRDARRSGDQGKTARRELDDALRSLGLRKDRIFRQSGRMDDDLRNMRESLRTAPPLEYQEQLKAYSRGISKSGATVEENSKSEYRNP